MKKKSSPHSLLMWNKEVPLDKVQDPLGLNLRGLARLGSQLLHCITSVTPRARYYSFLPWCIQDYLENEDGKSHSLGMREGIVFREQALVLGCVAHHGGKECKGGSLVGKNQAVKAYNTCNKSFAFSTGNRFTQTPAFRIYFNSLKNLGFFNLKTEDEDLVEEFDEKAGMDEVGASLEDLRLSPLGMRLAEAIERSISDLEVKKAIAKKDRKCSIDGLSELGSKIGLCELPHKGRDKVILRDIFFNRKDGSGKAHKTRRQSLLLMLDLAGQMGKKKIDLNQDSFATATYFQAALQDDKVIKIRIKPELEDITNRWRMFHFHYYMSVALEAVFSWLLSALEVHGIAGTTLEKIISSLSGSTIVGELSGFLGVPLEGDFNQLTPNQLFGLCGFTEDSLDQRVSVDHALSENNLEKIIRKVEQGHSGVGLALPLILFSLTLSRFKRWTSTRYGIWLAKAARDISIDLIPPTVLHSLDVQFQGWQNQTFGRLARYVLERFVINQHLSMAYERTNKGERCLIRVDGQRIASTGRYDRIGLGNGRFRSARQILLDLAMLEETDDSPVRLTSEGLEFYDREITQEVGDGTD